MSSESAPSEIGIDDGDTHPGDPRPVHEVGDKAVHIGFEGGEVPGSDVSRRTRLGGAAHERSEVDHGAVLRSFGPSE